MLSVRHREPALPILPVCLANQNALYKLYPEPTYPVDVANGRGRAVIINDHVHTFEVYAPPHEISANQNPDLRTERKVKFRQHYSHLLSPVQ